MIIGVGLVRMILRHSHGIISRPPDLNVMENAVKLSLPTPVDPKRGERWGKI